MLNNFADDRNLSLQGMNRLVERLIGPEPPPPAPTPVVAAPAQETVAAQIDPDLEKKLKAQTEALNDIRAAADRAAKNNRLRAEVGRILQQLNKDLSGD